MIAPFFLFVSVQVDSSSPLVKDDCEQYWIAHVPPAAWHELELELPDILCAVLDVYPCPEKDNIT